MGFGVTPDSVKDGNAGAFDSLSDAGGHGTGIADNAAVVTGMLSLAGRDRDRTPRVVT